MHSKVVKWENRGYCMVDPDILLLAIVNMAEGVKNLIGDKGAKAVLRDAGKQAGPKLLESLIGHFPETLTKEEALRRACIILEDLGFAKKIEKTDSSVKIEEDIFTDAITSDHLTESPVIYFFAGLIEGFVSFMSNEKITLIPESVERGKIVYKY
jgi:predicted hydrocarbon binding protein